MGQCSVDTLSVEPAACERSPAGHTWTIAVGGCHSRGDGHLRNRYCHRCHRSENDVVRVVWCETCRALPPREGAIVVAGLGTEIVDDHAWSPTELLREHVRAEGHAWRTSCVRCRAERAGVGARGTAACAACHPAAPRIEAPGEDATVPMGAVELRWQVVPGAASYRVTVIDLDRDHAILADHVVSDAVCTIEPALLTPGHAYRLAVRAATDLPYDDAPAAGRGFRIQPLVRGAARAVRAALAITP